MPDPCERLMQFFDDLGDVNSKEYIVNYLFKDTVTYMLKHYPHNQELTLAIRALQEARMYAIASVIAV